MLPRTPRLGAVGSAAAAVALEYAFLSAVQRFCRPFASWQAILASGRKVLAELSAPFWASPRVFYSALHPLQRLLLHQRPQHLLRLCRHIVYALSRPVVEESAVTGRSSGCSRSMCFIDTLGIFVATTGPGTIFNSTPRAMLPKPRHLSVRTASLVLKRVQHLRYSQMLVRAPNATGRCRNARRRAYLGDPGATTRRSIAFPLLL